MTRKKPIQNAKYYDYIPFAMKEFSSGTDSNPLLFLNISTTLPTLKVIGEKFVNKVVVI